ncbi:relaxase/mobilization nuclease domain-containing protein [Mucilaginibacter paludis]|uniref:Relaxase/mobilization nuclease family protein n=1 Tax=Mucilaginibacter paludis DSM 18603 TaxID=714943 RepID=H1YHD2_9SPHI|nr:relaxase/mobilization nuclease domain-containing protein [Mucilaginibacter paludis]EHQ25466.1 Relaxase/mobilization nuclease family protein [Mucilaginibacter paludis DSM 18603]
MVAKISTGKSIRGMLHYNENKVTAGEASLILASGFAGEIEKMNFNQKLQRFNHLTELKPNVKTNALHISLNFDASENLSNAKLQDIAIAYMERIGFGDQPFLVYRHDDAAHQHIHIATTNITAAGERIDLHNIGKLLSEPARKSTEQEFKLVRAESRKFKQEPGIKPADLTKAQYGQLPTKRAISNVVTAVTRDYKYTSLAELNAVLKSFNVVALRGAEHTAMFEKKGLMFSLIDKNGKALGVPIKASSFYSKPTLRNLEKKFEKNIEKRKVYKEPLKNAIDQTLRKYTAISKSTFVAELKNYNIQVAFRSNEQGRTYGITYINHGNKSVFNGSDLGKAYSAKALIEQFTTTDKLKVKPQQTSLLTKNRPSVNLLEKEQKDLPNLLHREPDKLLQSLLKNPNREDGSPLMPRKKRKKRKGMRF